MKTNQIEFLVRRWFSQAEQACGPVLPDGWFGGRPYENTFLLQDVKASEDLLVIRLSEDTILSFVHPKRVCVENSELIIGDFDQVTFRWKDYGGSDYHEKQYGSGQVKLVPPVGTAVTIA